MKFAFMSFSTPDKTLEQILDLARAYGYEGVEPRLDAKHHHGIEVAADAAERAALRDKAEQSGIVLAGLATSLKFADPATTEATVDAALERIDLAYDMGVPALRVFGGNLPDGLDRRDAVKTAGETLLRVADYAAEREVTLCFETHDDWCNPADVAAVMQYANHKAVAVNWDIMHPVRRAGVTIDQSFETLKPWIRHLHVHDGITNEKGGAQLMPIGEGIIDHRRALECLATIDYKGYISGEWIGWADAYNVHLPRELKTLRGYLESQQAG